MGYDVVLGFRRKSIVLLALLLLPALAKVARLRELRWLCGYVLLSSTVLLCPVVPKLFGSALAPVFGWRIYWSWPVPLLLGLTVGAAVSGWPPLPRLRAFLVGLAVMVFAFAWPTAVSQGNWSWANIGRFKVSPGYAVAERLMALAPGNHLVLAPEDIAVDLAGFANAPPLIGVRGLYLSKLKGSIPDRELAEREGLLNYIGAKPGALTATKAMEAIDRRRIAAVAFRADHRDADCLAKSLAERDFLITGYKGYLLAAKPGSRPRIPSSAGVGGPRGTR